MDWPISCRGPLVRGVGRCLPPDQRILTPEGYRPISAVDVRESVVTALGRARLVTAIDIWDVDEPLYHFRTVRGHALRSTGEHPVLARRGDGLPEWVRSEELRSGDAVGVYGATALPWRPGQRRPEWPRGGVTVMREESSLYLGLDWVPLIAADAAPYAGPVYALDVEEDHSFVSEGIVLGACGRR